MADRFLREKQVLELIPMARSTWWVGVKDGRYPQPVKLSKRLNVWLASEIQELIEHLTKEGRNAAV